MNLPKIAALYANENVTFARLHGEDHVSIVRRSVRLCDGRAVLCCVTTVLCCAVICSVVLLTLLTCVMYIMWSAVTAVWQIQCSVLPCSGVLPTSWRRCAPARPRHRRLHTFREWHTHHWRES